MSTLIKALLSESHIFQNYRFKLGKPLVLLIGSSSRFSHDTAFSSKSDQNANNSILANYLIDSLKFSKNKALLFSRSYLRTKSIERPQEVVRFFKSLGLSDAHIQSIAHVVPQILFSNIEKTLKPKVTLLQELGLSDLIFKNPFVLTMDSERTLMPSINLIRKVLQSCGRCRNKEQVNDYLLRVLTRCRAIIYMTSRLETSILYLESRGIVGSQLSTLLLARPRLFTLSEQKLEELVSRAVDMDFNMGSRMLAHAISVLASASIKTLNGKFEVFMMFGFSKGELTSMFRKSPSIFTLSEANARRKLEYFLNSIKINRLVIVRCPRILCCSLEKKLIPRYNVLEILKSRGLLRSDLGIQQAMILSDNKFSEKYIKPFRYDLEEAVLADKDKPVLTTV